MVGQYTNRYGYTRNFAYRNERPVLIREDRVIELNPAISMINDTLVVQAKPSPVEKEWIKISEGTYQGEVYA